MSDTGYTLFDTAIGTCALAWGPLGLTRVQLPEASEARARARLLRGLVPAPEEGPPPPEVQAVIGRIRASLERACDLCDVVIDMRGVPPFHQRVYELARAIPPGQTLTYGEVAARLGQPGASRAVGQALGHNPFAPVVPCHRVLAAGRRSGGFSAEGGARTKLRMLQIEGAALGASPDTLDLF